MIGESSHVGTALSLKCNEAVALRMQVLTPSASWF